MSKSTTSIPSIFRARPAFIDTQLMIQLLINALQITAPLLALLIFGIFLKRIQFIDDHFVGMGNKLVFKIGLPCLLFLSIATRPDQATVDTSLIIYAFITTLISVGVVWMLSGFLVSPSKKGVFTQCAFRGNMGIIGLALCINAYGDEGLAQISVYLGVMTVTYNILAVLLLSSSRQNILGNLISNPLIIGIVLGYAWSATSVDLPIIVKAPVEYLGNLTLPLALICIGASLDWSSLKENHEAAMWCTSFKLALLPVAICIGALLLGIKGQSLGILFLMMSAPTAAAGYVMAKQMTKHGHFAAEVVTLSTLLSPLTITLGLVLLKYYQLM